jgi:methyl-accepting chemotaxis protein
MNQAATAAETPITLDGLRRGANKFLLATNVGMTLLCGAVAIFGHQNILLVVSISGLATICAGAAVRLYGITAAARISVATALAVQVMMVIFAASNLDGSHVQEAHMIYFVLNCYLLSYACWRALLAYNLVVVAHHVVLTFFAPAWVWTADSGASGLSHLIIHASIAIILVGPLIFVAVHLHDMIINMHSALATAGQERKNALAKADEAEESRRMTVEARRKAEAERAATAAQQAFVVEAIAEGLESLANGDLIFRLNTEFNPGYEKLRENFNAALDRLQSTMRSVGANAQAVRSGTQEITQASDDLARRTEQQAASLEETAAALDQITATVRKTAEGAQAAREVVAAAKTDAERSGNVVNETVAAMTGIETSAEQIGNIIGVIDEIAFQTNLLALNAGIEAARAGDAGRGFAVVATEVRALAQRSAEAAKEIKTLISASGAQVASGVTLVGETGKALGRNLEQVAQLNRLVSEIAASAQEQASGLHEVNKAVNLMDQVTQQNAAMVEQATAASHSLAGEATELAKLVAQFQTGAAVHAEAARLPAPKPMAANSRIPAPPPVGKFIAAPADHWDEF